MIYQSGITKGVYLINLKLIKYLIVNTYLKIGSILI